MVSKEFAQDVKKKIHASWQKEKEMNEDTRKLQERFKDARERKKLKEEVEKRRKKFQEDVARLRKKFSGK